MRLSRVLHMDRKRWGRNVVCCLAAYVLVFILYTDRSFGLGTSVEIPICVEHMCLIDHGFYL